MNAASPLRTALDKPAEELDALERDFVAKIRNRGWHRANVFADKDGPGFTYTTGFWLRLGAPEVITFSLKWEIAQGALSDMYGALKRGRSFAIGERFPFFDNAAGVLLPVSRARHREYMAWSSWFYDGDDFPCLQLVWPDVDGNFPWQPGYPKWLEPFQPDLTECGWTKIESAS